MASLLLGGIGSGIGASIGGSFLGMSASSIGWMLGSSLGNLIFAEKQHVYGPRLKGDRFTGSALGQVRPIVYGTCKVEGKIIWQTPYHEHEHTEDSGGKGGGGTEYTTYTYTRSFAIMLCEGAIEAVRKIWINGKLEFDFSENSNVAAGMQSGTKVNDIKFYYGTDTQLPDPTIESFDGVGNVPAYRGTAYIVFTEYDVTDSQGACPIVEVEVVANASLASATGLGNSITTDVDNFGQIGYVNEGVLYYSPEARSSASNYFERIGVDLSNGNVVYSDRFGTGYNTIQGYQRGPFSEDQYYYYHMGTDLIDSPIADSPMVATYIKLGTGETAYVGRQRLYHSNGAPLYVSAFGVWKDVGTLENFVFKRGVTQTYLYGTSVRENTDGKRWVQRWDMPSNYASARYDFTDGMYAVFCYPSSDGDVYVFNEDDEKVYRLDADLNLLDSRDVPIGVGAVDSIAYADGLLWFGCNLLASSGNGLVYAYDWNDMSLVGSVSDLAYGVSSRPASRTCSMYASGNSVAVTIDGRLYTVAVRRVTRQSATLSDIVADLHQRCGQTADDYNVLALTDDVRGYLITEQVSARSSIEQLQIGYLFDANDSEGKIKYVKRGSSSIAALTADDLGAFENEPVAEWQISRQQEEELPQTLSIVYMDFNGSYEKAAQNATRQTVLAGDVTTFQVPIVFTANESQSVAQKQMMAAWMGRTKYKFTTNMEWASIEPCDVVTVQDKVMRITSRADGVNGIIEFEAVAELPSIYTNVGVGSLPSGYAEEEIVARGPTLFEILDLPPLRDADYNLPTEYLAATGVLDGWTSGAIMRSDNGDNYSLISLVNTESVMGNATTVLGDWDGGNVFDESNTVTVQLSGDGTLSSVTFDQALEGEFPFVLGNEVIFGRTATLVSTGVYTLSGFLRGRLGTEAYMSTHALNDRFVLLSASSIRKFTPRDNDLNTERYFKGVTSGNKISAATPKSHTYTGRNLKPFSPVSIGGGTEGLETAWTIRWVRRSRYRWQWLDEADVGADEDTYNFDVRIYDDAFNPVSVVRTITVTDASEGIDGFFSTTYSNANQIIDFGTHRRVLAVSVRQVGEFGNSDWSDIVVLDSGFASETIVLLNMDGSNGSTTFTDVYGHAFTAYGNAQISTAQFAPLTGNTASGLFDGTGDYIKTPYSVDFALANDNWTLEGFVRRATGAPFSGFGIASLSESYSTYSGIHAIINSSNQLQLLCSESGTAWDLNLSGATTLSNATWYHFAFVRFGNSFRIYLAGTLDASASASFSLYNAMQPLTFGAQGAAGENGLNGNLDSVRFSRGALYTSNFTPPTAPFTS
jgi:hypothetical protein